MRATTWSLLSLCSCILPDEDFDGDGWTAAEGDCADLDPTMHPGAEDILGDGLDQDCLDGDLFMEVSGKTHTCLLTEEGKVACTGDNRYGQLEVPGLDVQFTAIAAGDFHTCALEVTGEVVCWGDDEYGQSSGQSSAPAGTFVSITADANWSLGGYADGSAYCWGRCIIPALKP
jgi:hypothetical protein